MNHKGNNANSSARLKNTRFSWRKKYKFILIDKSKLNHYKEQGWEKIHNIQGRKVLKKGDHIVKVKPSDVDEFIKNGYAPSSCVESLIYIRKDKELKRIPLEYFEKYISEGWQRGNNTSGKIYIHNDNLEKRIYKDELETYQNWKIGRLPKVHLKKDSILRKVHKYRVDIIDSLLANGYVIVANEKSDAN